MNAVENKIPNVSNLVKKYLDIESEYITTADYNKFTKDTIANEIKSEGLVHSAIARLITNADLNNKIETVATKAELKTKQDKITKLQ